MQKAYSPKFSQNLSPPYDATGSVKPGKRPLPQLKVPASATTPAMVVPCPPMNFVAEWITMSAPCSIGRQRYGVASVESMTSGRFSAWATSARAAMSATVPDGLATISV